MGENVSPQQAVDFMLEQKGLERADLAEWLGGRSRDAFRIRVLFHPSTTCGAAVLLTSPGFAPSAGPHSAPGPLSRWTAA